MSTKAQQTMAVETMIRVLKGGTKLPRVASSEAKLLVDYLSAALGTLHDTLLPDPRKPPVVRRGGFR